MGANLCLRRLTFAAALALLAGMLGQGADAATAAFGTPVALSLNGHAADASVGIDDAGDATAVWTDGALYFSDHPRGGAWTAPGTFSGGAGAGFAAMRMSALGAATVVTWGSGYGIYAIDRPAGGSWGTPATLVAAPQLVNPLYTGARALILVENPAGDAAVIYEQLSGGATLISAVRRPFGGAWSAQETVASSAVSGPISLAGASIGAGGDVLVTWETFQVVCNRYCHDINYVTHGSREGAPGGGWADSGTLTAQGSAWLTGSAIDPAGAAVTLIQPSFGTIITANRQRRAGAKWSAPVTAYTANGAIALIYGAEASPLGRVSLLTGMGGVWDVDGAIGPNTWTTPLNLAAGDNPAPVAEIAYGASGAGGLSVTWVDADGTVRAATRKNAITAWAPTQTLAPGSACNIGGVVCSGPAAAAIDAHGHAVVLYFRLDPTVTIHTLYAATN